MPDGGKVGIGTTTPNSILDIKGLGDGSELLRLSTERPWVFRQTSSGTTTQLDIHSTASDKNLKITSLNNTRAAQFFVSDDITKNRAFLVPDGGKVGIGITTPDATLAVNGDIHTQEVRVDLNGWADFVFENNHNLPTLKEVELYIKDKGHLKDIPSAQEVAKNGILLGEMNTKLLQKIEELTLYIIEQEKRIETLENLIRK